MTTVRQAELNIYQKTTDLSCINHTLYTETWKCSFIIQERQTIPKIMFKECQVYICTVHLAWVTMYKEKVDVKLTWHDMIDIRFGISAGWIWSSTLTYGSMSVVPFRPFHACMNSKAVTLLSCGGAAGVDNDWDEGKVLAGALTDATELSSALTDSVVTESPEELTAAADNPLDLAVFNITKYTLKYQPVTNVPSIMLFVFVGMLVGFAEGFLTATHEFSRRPWDNK